MNLRNNIEPFFHSVYPELVMYCRAILNNHEDAEDIAADALVKVIKGNYTIECDEDLRRIVFPIGKNLCIDHNRRWHVQQAYKRKLTEEIDQEVDFDHIEARVIEKIFQEMKQLPAQHREIIAMYLKGKQTADIETALSLHRRYIQRVRQAFIGAIAKYYNKLIRTE
jgi:RNA polymerase sigma factor (sigma-70 family)